MIILRGIDMPSITDLKNNVMPVYDSLSFRQMIEDHLPIIRANKCATIQIEPVQADRYNGNFYGLLNTLKMIDTSDTSKTDRQVTPLPIYMYWIALRCNGFYSPLDFDGSQTQILIPEIRYISELLNTHLMRKK